MIKIQGEEHLEVHELADRWGFSTGTLANWRSGGGGPAYRQPGGKGGRVYYPISEIQRYEELRDMTPRTELPGLSHGRS